MSFLQKTFTIRVPLGCHLVTSEVASCLHNELASISASGRGGRGRGGRGDSLGAVVHLFLNSGWLLETSDKKKKKQERNNKNSNNYSPAYGSLTLNENADPTVRPDLMHAVQRMIGAKPEQSEHASQLRSVLFGRDLLLPVRANGRFDFGTWQGIYLCAWGNEGKEQKGKSSQIFEYSIIATIRSGLHLDQRDLQVYDMSSRGCHSITSALNQQVNECIPDSNNNDDDNKGYTNGLAVCLLRHTSAALSLASKNSSSLSACMEECLNTVVPDRWNDEFFVHTYEGPDDMPGHVKSALVGANLVLPVSNSALSSTISSHDVYVCEHRDCGGWGGGHSRKVHVTYLPNSLSSSSSSSCFFEQSMLELTFAANQQLVRISAEQLSSLLPVCSSDQTNNNDNDNNGNDNKTAHWQGFVNLCSGSDDLSLVVASTTLLETDNGDDGDNKDDVNDLVRRAFIEMVGNGYEKDWSDKLAMWLMGYSVTVPIGPDGALALDGTSSLVAIRSTTGLNLDYASSVQVTVQATSQ